ncbi:MAG TPA: hypothetical protein DCY94_04460 [Firmicutes bacterium]|nr:hypothetical protein [Bacillota bacterium]
MKDRGMKKWRPFKAISDMEEMFVKPNNCGFPNLSESEIAEYEETLKNAMYVHSQVKITYIEGGSKKCITDFVVELDDVKKDIILKTKKINFRQIYKVTLA